LQKSGFTLLELMVALAIVGVVTGIAIPYYYNMLPHIRMKNAAGEISTELMKARMRSIAKRTNYTCTFNLYTNIYTITFTQPQGLLSGPGMPVAGVTYSQTEGRTWNGKINLYSDTSDPTVLPLIGNKVVFRSDGTAADGTGVAITGSAGSQGEAVYIEYNPDTGERYRVRIVGITGNISMERWSGATWVNGY